MSEINDIRKRHEHVANDKGYAWTPCGISAHLDRATLLAKVNELEQDFQDMTDFRDHWKIRYEKLEAALERGDAP